MNSLGSQIKSLAEDCAYSFKGLYKQSDIEEKYYKILIFAPIITSILFLVFPGIANVTFGKIMAIITLIFSIILLIGSKNSENIIKYRELANDFKTVYDQLYLLSYKEDVTHEEIKKLSDLKNDFTKNTAQYPIGFFAKIWTRICIRKEMNIEWLYNKK